MYKLSHYSKIYSGNILLEPNFWVRNIQPEPACCVIDLIAWAARAARAARVAKDTRTMIAQMACQQARGF